MIYFRRPSIDVGDPTGDHAAKSVKCAAPVDAVRYPVKGRKGRKRAERGS